MSLTDAVSPERSAGAVVALNARTGVVFRRTLQDNLPAILGWGMGYSILLAAVSLLYPAMKANNTLLGIAGSLNLFSQTSEDLAEITTFTTFGGYLGVMALNLAPQILSVFLASQALGAVSREEERGTLDILLSAPIPRWRFLVEKTLAIIVSLLAILTMMWTTLAVCSLVVTGADLPLLNLTAGIGHLPPISLAILTASLLISLCVHSSRLAGGLIALFLLVNFFWRAVLMWVDVPLLAPFKSWTIFYYYRIVPVFVHGTDGAYDRVLLILAAVLFAAALWRFQRRDLMV